jgi:hypothetical protein
VPTTAQLTFTNTGLVPFYGGYQPKRHGVKLPNSVAYARGTVLGEKWGVNAVYTVTLGTQSSGSFTLTVGANTTAGIPFNATAAAVQTALTGLASVGANNATVTGAAGGPYTVTFQNALGAQAVTMTGSGAALTTPGNFSVASAATGSAGTPGTFTAYAVGNTDGSQVPRAILEHDCATDASGNVTLGPTAGGSEWGQTQPYASAFFAGDFATGELTGLDPAGIAAAGWRLVNGNVAAGVVRLP